MAAHPGPAGQIIDAGCVLPIPAEDQGRRVRTGESVERARAPCSAARWCTGCCNRCPTSRGDAAATRRWPILPATPTAGARAIARRLPAQVLALIEDRALRRCLRRAAAPRSRSPDGWIGRDGRRRWFPGQIDRLVVTPSEVLIVDYKTNHAPPESRPTRPPPMSASSRSTARCWQSFIPSCRSAPRCCGPKRLN